ncbi:4018_t:CDS:2 [Funneliformis mosseae]|uniref:4018_t:CDS:1 n=1 Tax=Funneliformis mosseae TaxID=27381 RepID=A0A9N8ZJZ7_FUNMO|nr:4018_t:CDS:2 [Funneliformis mosseae]
MEITIDFSLSVNGAPLRFIGELWLDQVWLNPTSTESAYPLFPETVREWTGFFQGVGLTVASSIFVIPGGQIPICSTEELNLRVKGDAKIRMYYNILSPINKLLVRSQGLQGIFCETLTGFLGLSDHVLCTNNFTVAKMPVEMKMCHNLNLRGYNLWEVCRNVDRDQIRNRDLNFKFKKRILSQVFCAMACNGLHYGILSNYSDTYFHKRDEASSTTLYVTCVVQPNDVNLTLRECVYYISRLAFTDNANNRLSHITLDNISSSDSDDDDPNKIGGNAIPPLSYEGYVYDRYFYALALQLVEDARHIDPTRNILFEPRSRHFFFVDLGLSEFVGTGSLKLRKEEKRLKKLLQLRPSRLIQISLFAQKCNNL